MHKGILVYISGPITPKNGNTIEGNVANGLELFIRLTKMGIPAFCPHLTAAFPSAHADVPYKTWMDYDLAVIARCTHMLMMRDWRLSIGARQEREYAESIEIPVVESVTELAELLDVYTGE